MFSIFTIILVLAAAGDVIAVPEVSAETEETTDTANEVEETAKKAAESVGNAAKGVWGFLTKRGDNPFEKLLKEGKEEDKKERELEENYNWRTRNPEAAPVGKSNAGTDIVSASQEFLDSITRTEQTETTEKKVGGTSTILALFSTRENATDVENKFEEMSNFSKQLYDDFFNLHQAINRDEFSINSADKIAVQQSILISKVFDRIRSYSQTFYRCIQEVMAGIVVLKSTHSAKEEAYQTGLNRVSVGLIGLKSLQTDGKSILAEMRTLQKLFTVRAQNDYASILSERSQEIAKRKEQVQTLYDTYEQEICPKVTDIKLSTTFNESLQAMSDITHHFSLFIEFTEKLSAYYNSDQPFDMKIE